jgi:hypothetical protein
VRPTRKGTALTRNIAAAQLLTNILLANKVGACEVATLAKRRKDYVVELVIPRPRKLVLARIGTKD